MHSAASSSSACVVAVGDFPRFDRLIARLGFERCAQLDSGRFCLIESDQSLELRPPEETQRAGIRATFPPDHGGSPGSRKSALARAFGKRIETVFDLTAGLGSDAYRLAAAGFHVRAWERDAAVFALLSSAWTGFIDRGAEPELARRLSFTWGDGADGLREAAGPAVAVYLDPMYPAPKRASALPKRNLQVLRLLLGAESQGDENEIVRLADQARAKFSRVVVKRPHHAKPLLPEPNHSIDSKLVRFDVYTNPERMEADAW